MIPATIAVRKGTGIMIARKGRKMVTPSLVETIQEGEEENLNLNLVHLRPNKGKVKLNSWMERSSTGVQNAIGGTLLMVLTPTSQGATTKRHAEEQIPRAWISTFTRQHLRL